MMSADHQMKGKEVTVGAGTANLYGALFMVPSILLIVVPYIYLWPEQFTKEKIRAYLDARGMMTFMDMALLFLVMIVGIVLHELLHGLGWASKAKRGWKSISFGFIWKFLTPYCHCSEAFSLRAYRFGSVLPGIVLGIIPAIASLFTGQIGLMLFGFFFTIAAGGDFLILWLLRNENIEHFVQDHPEKIGCIIFEK